MGLSFGVNWGSFFKTGATDGQVFKTYGNREIPSDDDDNINYYRDDFDSPTTSLDTTNRWNTATLTGTGSVAIASGICTMQTGTTNGSTAKIKMKIAKNLGNYETLNLKVKFKLTETASTDCTIKIGLYNSAEDKYVFVGKTNGTTDGKTLTAIEDGGGENGTEIVSDPDGTWRVYRVSINLPKNWDTFIDAVIKDDSASFSQISDDLYLYAYILNHAASNQKIELAWIELEGL